MTRNIIRNFLIFITLLIMFSISQAYSPDSHVQDLSKYFTANDYFDFEWISDPQISPSGRRIVYVRNFADILSDQFYSNLWIVNFDGTGNRPLTSGLSHDGSPRWSPDGSMIIYISDKEGKPQIYKRWMDTEQTVILTNLLFPPNGITWSPDGKWIAFSAPVPSIPRTIAQLPPAPPGAKWAPPATIIDKTIYRFDGIGYQIGMGYMQLFVMPTEGGTPRQITQGNYHHPYGIFGDAGLSWTPDGKYIVLSANRREDWELYPMDTELFEVRIADGAIRALTDRRGGDGSPAVSPDGKLIAYTGFDEKNWAHHISGLYVMSRDGSDPRLLTVDLDRGVYNIQWADDSNGIHFLYDDKGHTKLALIALNGTVKDLAGNIGGGRAAYGGFGSSYSIAPNGNFAYTYSRPDHPSDVAVASVASSKVRILTAVNEDILGHKQLAEVEEMWYECSKDGRKIHGWIMKPPDFDPANKYPLILEIHGGPWSNYGDRFSVEKQLLASAGYVVLYTNPRGSTSYGEEFINLINHNYPADDYYDLMSGVDVVIENGYIDENNLFITGGSGGGILSCWSIGKTDRFRAAAPLYPVVDWYSEVLTCDIGSMSVNHHFTGFPWDNAEHYLKYSPISLVGNVKTPTMIITGEQDFRTPMPQSEEFYMALKLQGVEALLVRFPGASHGITNRPSQHLSKMQHIIAWFDQHKKTE